LTYAAKLIRDRLIPELQFFTAKMFFGNVMFFSKVVEIAVNTVHVLRGKI